MTTVVDTKDTVRQQTKSLSFWSGVCPDILFLYYL